MKKLLFIIILILISVVSAQEINVIKDAPNQIRSGDILNIEISISNQESIKKSYEIIETIPQGFSLIEPNQPDRIEQRNALSVMTYRWEVEIPSNKIFSLNYKIKPDKVGEYIIPPTKVTDLTTNLVSLSEPKQVVVLCVPNNKCEENENSINCPEDCGASLSDGICNYKADGICDPDCEEEPDCKNIEVNIFDIFKDTYIYNILIGIILILIIVFTIKKFTKLKKNENKEIQDKILIEKAIESIKLFREQGYSDEQIKQEFLKKGWSNNDVNDLFSKY